MSDPEHWLKMAAEARAKADRMRTTYARRFVLDEAARYEQRAQQAKCRAPLASDARPMPERR
jgi:hypothetical protein